MIHLVQQRYLRYLLMILLIVFTAGCRSTPQDDGLPHVDRRHWYKGNLHTHSLWSDGDDFPEMIVDWYRVRGYDFLTLSDHNILSEGTKWMSLKAISKPYGLNDAARGKEVLDKYIDRFGKASVDTRGSGDRLEVRLKTLMEFRPMFEQPGEFVLIQSEEITDSFNGLVVHMNATNLRYLIPPQHGNSIRDTIRNNLRAAIEQEKQIGQPILVHTNHPHYDLAVTAEDLADVVEEKFFEVYNGFPGCGNESGPKLASVGRLWDIANTIRVAELGAPPLFGLAGDDSHYYYGREGGEPGNKGSPGRGWIMVQADALDAESLISAMRNGDFYASSGVTLHRINYSPRSRTIDLQIDPEPGVNYTIEFIGTEVGYDRSSEPVVNDRGQPLRVTKIYSTDVGKVYKTVRGTLASFKVPTSTLYVRAVVTSDKPPTNPLFDGQLQQAWTQPVGWESHVRAE